MKVKNDGKFQILNFHCSEQNGQFFNEKSLHKEKTFVETIMKENESVDTDNDFESQDKSK